MNKKSVAVFLAVIFLVALTCRIYKLGIHPIGFFCDEVATGYNAYKIITTGRDEYGQQLPILFRSFGNYRPGLPMYLTAPLVGLFGLNEFSTRLPAAVIGALTVLAVFKLGKTLFNSALIGLLSALFLAISPWHIQFSRYAEGHICLVFFLCLSLWLFFLSLQKTKLLPISFFFFAISFYTYFPAYFLIPLMMLTITIIYFKRLWAIKKMFLLSIVIFAAALLPLAWQLIHGEALARFKQVSSANQGKTRQAIAKQMLITYKDHFSLDFLFFKGDIDYPTHFITRFSVRGMGQLYLFQLPLILVGILAIFKNKQACALMLGWLLIYPLGSTAAPFADGGGPFATRSIIGVVPWQILSALGAAGIFNIIKGKKVKIILTIISSFIIIFSFGKYINRYFIQYPLYSSDFWGWQYGPRKIIQYFFKVENNYDELIMSYHFNAPEVFLDFYAPDNCQKCRIGDLSLAKPNLKQLFALTQEEIKTGQNEIVIHQKIYYPNNQLAFVIFELAN